MQQYKELTLKILAKADAGSARKDRTGTGTVGVFGHQMRFDLQASFPLVHLKKTFMRGVIEELLWMLSGSTDNNVLIAKGVHIWDAWADQSGQLGPIYGAQWRSWVLNHEESEVLDQIQELMINLRDDPYSRRHVVTAWNPADLPDPALTPQENASKGLMALAPCHCLFQFYVEDMSQQERAEWYDSFIGYLNDDMQNEGYTPDVVDEYMDNSGVPAKKLSCQLYQRSCDVFLGLPFNIASYALLTHMIAHQLDMDVGEFVWTGGDVHLYRNHLDQAREMVSRVPKFQQPQLRIKRKPESLFDYKIEDFEIVGYDPHPPLKGDVSV